MILTLIGMLLLFCAVMLLFSLIVSSLVELLQKMRHWRQKNLRLGLTALSYKITSYAEQHLTLNQAEENICWQRNLADVYHQLLTPMIQNNGHSFFQSLGFEYARSDISLQELQQVTLIYVKKNVALSYDVERDLKNEISLSFARLELEMKGRYRRKTHASALLFSFILSFVMQLNAFSLLETGYKQSLESSAEVNFQTLVAECKLSKDFKDVEIACLTNHLIQAQVIELTIFAKGAHYYYPLKDGSLDWKILLSRLVGMFVCIIFISLGAPFWFERLKSIYSLQEKIK
ncbi:hypothetical protein [Pseudoalteromonas tunicata]|jgi:hypothetical protein|uniref:Uncharacterized protein n=1 Tax=Pseudoalteromonas tunicata D2 TaxID=87626 RepID=A4CC55_9GAMM|nr:hypothetical protein [Pseudoalteromonas tunicata]ATC94491.1 hypothetical protein PTUN_a1936 [Pseudoalteromonas tunicata]AXT30218.1 hypothetical protein D1819_04940 [Pseudoalteromonas tunicata]EAR27942.1 hypothetical protein PTD2_19010 [Pseudoalteromonas tunicata D2]